MEILDRLGFVTNVYMQEDKSAWVVSDTAVARMRPAALLKSPTLLLQHPLNAQPDASWSRMHTLSCLHDYGWTLDFIGKHSEAPKHIDVRALQQSDCPRIIYVKKGFVSRRFLCCLAIAEVCPERLKLPNGLIKLFQNESYYNVILGGQSLAQRGRKRRQTAQFQVVAEAEANQECMQDDPFRVDAAIEDKGEHGAAPEDDSAESESDAVPEHVDEVPSSSSSSSQSSSSSSSSTSSSSAVSADSDVGEDALGETGEEEEPEQDVEEELVPPPPKRARGAGKSLTRLDRQLRDETFVWKEHRFTFRQAKDGKPAGYQVICKAHSYP
eukprot:3510116-Amphidinium_carterae.1